MDKCDQAEAETVAQLEVIRALKPLSQKRRHNVLLALKLIMAADELIPGIMETMTRMESRAEGRS